MSKYIISKEFDALEMEFKLTEKGGSDLLPCQENLSSLSGERTQ